MCVSVKDPIALQAHFSKGVLLNLGLSYPCARKQTLVLPVHSIVSYHTYTQGHNPMNFQKPHHSTERSRKTSAGWTAVNLKNI